MESGRCGESEPVPVSPSIQLDRIRTHLGDEPLAVPVGVISTACVNWCGKIHLNCGQTGPVLGWDPGLCEWGEEAER